ncbi:MAG TPA: hypothetical protein VJ180_01105, partial [Pyrinomonadaceae bacterium]|nr:hypothetical protein [Pyrinomonadaceae bacterium]
MPPLNGVPRIVGAEQEQEKTIFATGDYVYIDAGSAAGVREGQEFHIVRPRGEIEHIRRSKKGSLGVFFQEIGQLQVVRVKEAVSVAQVNFTCETVMPGDLLTGVPERVTPKPTTDIPFDRFSDPTGKPNGRIIMGHAGREMVATGDIIYIDIGDEDKVVPGDLVTIYRRVGTGNLDVKTYDMAPRDSVGFASEQYRGGGLSINAQRSKAVGPGMYSGEPVSTEEIKDKRPALPRKILGEAMVINVQVRTATAIVRRAAQEIHTGDFVELR